MRYRLGCALACLLVTPALAGCGAREPDDDDAGSAAAVATDAPLPQGHALVYESFRNGGSDLAVLDGGAAEPRFLTDTKDVWEEDPAWSPDGKQVAFVRWRYVGAGDDVESKLYVIAADGSDERQLTDDGLLEAAPVWISNEEIAFQACADDGELAMSAAEPCPAFIVSSAGGEVRPGRASDPRYGEPSPDGRRIAYVSDQDGNGDCRGWECVGSANELYVADADGSNETRLTHDVYDEQTVAWSPDGSRLVFSSIGEYSDEDGGHVERISVMNADGTCKVELTTGFRDNEPRWFGPADELPPLSC